MEINRGNVIEIISKSGLKPDKDYGQNYLLEPELCSKIVDFLDVKNNEKVLEIGPGLGSLTHFLTSKKAEKIDLVDIDERMVNFLKILYKEDSVSIILRDIRKHDVSQYDKILGNLPYNITTETVVYLLENAKNAKKMVLMCQAEAFPRFSETSGGEYGPASILVHLLGSSKRLLTVKPGSFYPAPKCSSIVFEISINERVDYDHCISVYKFAKKLFLNRRKTIQNNLNNVTNNKEVTNTLLEKVGISSNRRPEEILPKKFEELYNAFINL